MSDMGWLHYNPVNVRFGRGCRADLLPILSSRKCLIVTSENGRKRLTSDPLLGRAFENSSGYWVDNIESNPDLHALQKLIDSLLEKDVDAVVAIGGGSVIDSGKVLALALASEVADLALEELIDIGSQYPIDTSLPLYAVPTTAGTGSEVTPFATVWDQRKKIKMSLSGPGIFPAYALVDPELTDSLPYDVTLSSGLDAINQAAESIWNKNLTPVSEAYGQAALREGFDALPKLLADLGNTVAREAMAQASVLAGLAISQTRTALCHAISYPLTSYFDVPHGLACAFTMSAVLQHNLRSNDIRFRRLANSLGCTDLGYKKFLIKKFQKLNNDLNVAAEVRAIIRSKTDLLNLAEKMVFPGRSDNMLVPASLHDIASILEISWDN